MSRRIKNRIRAGLVLGLLLFALGCIGGIERELIDLWGGAWRACLSITLAGVIMWVQI